MYKWVFFLLLCVFKIKKTISQCEQSCQTPAPHTGLSLNVTEYLTPSHIHLQPFHFSSFFSLHPSLCTWRRREELCFLFPWQGREGQAFTSPLPPAIISLIYAPLPPYLCSYLLPPTSVFLPFCLWHTAIGLEWSEVRKGEGGTHARHWTPDPSTRWTFSCRLPISSDTLSVFPIITLVSLPFLGQEHKG